MAECEICGRSQSSLNQIDINGIIFNSCNDCSSLGQIVKKTDSERRTYQQTGRAYSQKRMEKQMFNELKADSGDGIVCDDFADIIKFARQSRGLKQKDVAKIINEKESIIHSIETGKYMPNLKLAKKLEKFFNVKIIEAE